MTIALPKTAAVAARTAAIAGPSRKCRCQSSGRARVSELGDGSRRWHRKSLFLLDYTIGARPRLGLCRSVTNGSGRATREQDIMFDLVLAANSTRIGTNPGRAGTRHERPFEAALKERLGTRMAKQATHRDGGQEGQGSDGTGTPEGARQGLHERSSARVLQASGSRSCATSFCRTPTTPASICARTRRRPTRRTARRSRRNTRSSFARATASASS